MLLDEGFVILSDVLVFLDLLLDVELPQVFIGLYLFAYVGDVLECIV